MSAITFVRDADRTRVIFVTDLSPEEAIERIPAPVGFRLAAVNPDANPDTLREVPMDGDNYAG